MKCVHVCADEFPGDLSDDIFSKMIDDGADELFNPRMVRASCCVVDVRIRPRVRTTLMNSHLQGFASRLLKLTWWSIRRRPPPET